MGPKKLEFPTSPSRNLQLGEKKVQSLGQQRRTFSRNAVSHCANNLSDHLLAGDSIGGDHTLTA